MDVPEIDGVVYLDKEAKEHTFIKCKITKVKDYDLYGEVLD